jgi:hypothetical protein
MAVVKKKKKPEAPAPAPLVQEPKTRKAIVVKEGCSIAFRGGIRDAGDEIKPHELGTIADIDRLMGKQLEEVEVAL